MMTLLGVSHSATQSNFVNDSVTLKEKEKKSLFFKISFYVLRNSNELHTQKISKWIKNDVIMLTLIWKGLQETLPMSCIALNSI